MDEQYFLKRLELVKDILEKFTDPIDILAIAACLINDVSEKCDVSLEYIFKKIKEAIEYADEEEEDND